MAYELTDPDDLAAVKQALDLQKNVVATAMPVSTDDSSQGFSVNSKLFNSLTGIEYICRDATVGAASWVRQDNSDFFGYVSGRYYHGMIAIAAAGAAIAANSIRFHPIVVKERVTISELAVRVTTAEAGKSFQLAIYASDPATKLPTGSALRSTANMSAGTTGAMSAGTGTDVTIEPGLYWMGILGDMATAVFQAFGSNSTNIAAFLGGTATQVASGTSSSIAFLSTAATSGSPWPDLSAASFSYGNNSGYAAIFFRAG